MTTVSTWFALWSGCVEAGFRGWLCAVFHFFCWLAVAGSVRCSVAKAGRSDGGGCSPPLRRFAVSLFRGGGRCPTVCRGRTSLTAAVAERVRCWCGQGMTVSQWRHYRIISSSSSWTVFIGGASCRCLCHSSTARAEGVVPSCRAVFGATSHGLANHAASSFVACA